ncbi:MAG: GNAT family N-acetyltransferase [Rhodocyclaceae bacterium]|nr:GNAT family N-acetyltransferase [Rhodocyclaceae bacterium]
MLQTAFWGSLLERLGQGTPLYLVAERQGQRVGQLLLIQGPLVRHGGGGLRGAMARVAGLAGFGRLEYAEGPVLLDPVREAQVMRAFLGWIADFARRHRILVVRGADAVARPPADPAGWRQAFEDFGYAPSPWGTYLVDLSPEEDAIWQAVDHAVRKGVKKAVREGLAVRRIADPAEYRRAFLCPYLAWKGETDTLAEVGRKAGIVWTHPAHDDHYRYFVATDAAGETLGVLGMYLNAGIATEITSGIAPAAFERKLPVQDLLHWEMFRDARQAGCTVFDLAGVSPAPATPKEENIRRFKKKWGGRYVEYGRHEWRHRLLVLAARWLPGLAGPAP